MNNFVLIGIVVAAAIVVGAVGVSAMSQNDMSVPSQNAVEDGLSDVQSGIEDIDPGYGQVTKNEGAYSP
ncbi:hypothetical protein [Nitrosopumilus sp.]|uniref:hypothetical protein n=1 Tax=Nitrosopumilus sp. TaxID=2024843 RepID=UPI003B596279